MAVTKEVRIENRVVVVRELTVGEIRDWLRAVELEPVEHDIVNALLIDGVDLSDLVRMSSLTEADLAELIPSQLQIVLSACKELNADFFALRARLMAMGSAALAETSSVRSVA